MTHRRKWLAGLGVALLVLLGIGCAALSFIPSDEELGQRAAGKLQAALGVGVSIRSIHWTLLPAASVTIEDAVIDQPQPIKISRLTLYPDLSAALRRRIHIDRLDLDGAVIPQLSLRGLGKGGDKPQGKFILDELPLEHAVFHNVTWISRRGIPVIYDGEVLFDTHWRPRTGELRRPDYTPATILQLERHGQEDRWAVRINLGGGTANGEAQLQAAADGQMHLAGQLKPQQVEVESALRAFNRRSAVGGRLSGNTTLSADGATVAELLQSLNTKTPFVMGADSKLLRFDLDKAIHTLGKDHAGQTPLDNITGMLETQNTSEGMITFFHNIEAKSGSLSATGNAKLFNRHIDAEFAVDLVKGVVGVPLKVTGPTNDISVSVPGGAVAGAVVGTAVLPVIGTVIGARLGAAMGKMFGSGPADKSRPAASAPVAPKTRR